MHTDGQSERGRGRQRERYLERESTDRHRDRETENNRESWRDKQAPTLSYCADVHYPKGYFNTLYNQSLVCDFLALISDTKPLLCTTLCMPNGLQKLVSGRLWSRTDVKQHRLCLCYYLLGRKGPENLVNGQESCKLCDTEIWDPKVTSQELPGNAKARR